MNKISCEVIQDLIPLYIEKISSKESNRLVEEHMQECEECRQLRKEVQQALFISTDASEKAGFRTEKDEAEIFKQIMKKYRKMAMKKIKAAVIAVVAALIIFCGIRLYWCEIYLPVAYEDAVISTYTKIGERTQKEYFWLEGQAQELTRTWEGKTLVLEGKNSHKYRKEMKETGQLYAAWVCITDSDVERIVYRDETGNHVMWEK